MQQQSWQEVEQTHLSLQQSGLSTCMNRDPDLMHCTLAQVPQDSEETPGKGRRERGKEEMRDEGGTEGGETGKEEERKKE